MKASSGIVSHARLFNYSIWNMASSKSLKLSCPDPLFTLRSHTDAITDLAFSRDASSLASGSADGLIFLWDVKTRRTSWNVQAHPEKQGVLALSWLPSNFLLSHGRDGLVNLWDASSQAIDPVIVLNTMAAYSFCKASAITACTILAPSNESSSLNMWDLRSGGIMQTLHPGLDAAIGDYSASSPGMCMAALGVEPGGTSDTHVVLALHENGHMLVYDIVAGKLAADIALHKETGLCMDVFGLIGVSGGADDKVHVWRFDPLKLDIFVEHSFTLSKPGVGSVAIRDDGKIFAAGCWDTSVRIFGLSKPKALASLRYHAKTVAALRFASASTEGAELATGSSDCRIALWSLYPPSHAKKPVLHG